MTHRSVSVAALILCLLSVQAGEGNDELTVLLPTGIAIEFVWIEPGSFRMGLTDQEADTVAAQAGWFNFSNERPAHEVTLTRGFYLGRYELTRQQWRAVMEIEPWAGISGCRGDASVGPGCPATQLLYADIEEFLRRLNAIEEGSPYRLPTEAEWEYACRAGTQGLWAGQTTVEELATHAHFRPWSMSIDFQYAGNLAPNAWGLYDMLGNAFEWVADWEGPYTAEPQTDPTGPVSGATHMVRGGGSRFDPYAVVRSAARFGGPTQFADENHGVRIARSGPKITAVELRTWGEIKVGQAPERAMPVGAEATAP